nr:hypothetical protein [Bradyrhizobium sp. ARR65]
MKFVVNRPFGGRDAAARELMELANAAEPVQDSRIHIKKINDPFLYTPAECKAELECAIANGWLWLHGRGTYAEIAHAGAVLLA